MRDIGGSITDTQYRNRHLGFRLLAVTGPRVVDLFSKVTRRDKSPGEDTSMSLMLLNV